MIGYGAFSAMERRELHDDGCCNDGEVLWYGTLSVTVPLPVPDCSANSTPEALRIRGISP